MVVEAGTIYFPQIVGLLMLDDVGAWGAICEGNMLLQFKLLRIRFSKPHPLTLIARIVKVSGEA